MNNVTIINKIEEYFKNRDIQKLEDLVTDLKLDELNTSKKSKANISSFLKQMIKDIPEARVAWKGTYKVNNKWQICDGYKLIEFKDENDKIAETFYNEKCSTNTISFDSITNGLNFDRAIKIDMKLLNNILKINKLDKRKPNTDKRPLFYIIEETMEGMNSKWLYDILQFCETDTIYASNCKNAPYKITSDKYNCIMLPIRLMENIDTDEKKAKLIQDIKDYTNGKITEFIEVRDR